MAITTTAMETAVAGVMSVTIAAMSEARVVNTHPNAVLNATPTCQLTFNSPPPVVNDITEQETFRAREHSTFTVQEEAWDHGNIACLFKPLGLRREFKFLWPVLTCSECTFVHGAKPFIQINDEQFMASITNTTSWYNGVFISSFAQLAAHYAHITKDKRPTSEKLHCHIGWHCLIRIVFFFIDIKD